MYCAVSIQLKSVDIAIILWPKAEEWVRQRWGITRFEKCKSSEMVTINVKVEGGSTWVLTGLLSGGLNTCVVDHGCAGWEWYIGIPCCYRCGHSSSSFRPNNKYVTETERPPSPSLTNGSIAWHQGSVCCIFLCLECKEADKAFRGHVTPHLCEHCIVQFSVVLYSCCRICLWCCREGNEGGSEPILGDMYCIQ